MVTILLLTPRALNLALGNKYLAIFDLISVSARRIDQSSWFKIMRRSVSMMVCKNLRVNEKKSSALAFYTWRFLGVYIVWVFFLLFRDVFFFPFWEVFMGYIHGINGWVCLYRWLVRGSALKQSAEFLCHYTEDTMIQGNTNSFNHFFRIRTFHQPVISFFTLPFF